jgi:hypothetical protein
MLGIAQNKVSVSPAQPLDKAVSGHYASWINGCLSTYGGCNFPDIPCADGGQKVYYPRAYGASVQVPDGAVYLGGMDATSSISECLFINATDGTSTSIASLPVALDNFAATYYDGTIWVAGGQTNGVPNKDVYALPFSSGNVKGESGKQEAESGAYPRYKAFGMAYIRFAKEEKELFKLLFMRDRTEENISSAPDFEESVQLIMQINGLTEEQARLMHLEMWTCVHGIGVMLATSFLSLEWELISNILTDVYQGIRTRHLTEENA